jgi:hypothetical protein
MSFTASTTLRMTPRGRGALRAATAAPAPAAAPTAAAVATRRPLGLRDVERPPPEEFRPPLAAAARLGAGELFPPLRAAALLGPPEALPPLRPAALRFAEVEAFDDLLLLPLLPPRLDAALPEEERPPPPFFPPPPPLEAWPPLRAAALLGPPEALPPLRPAAERFADVDLLDADDLLAEAFLLAPDDLLDLLPPDDLADFDDFEDLLEEADLPDEPDDDDFFEDDFAPPLAPPLFEPPEDDLPEDFFEPELFLLAAMRVLLFKKSRLGSRTFLIRAPAACASRASELHKIKCRRTCSDCHAQHSLQDGRYLSPSPSFW